VQRLVRGVALGPVTTTGITVRPVVVRAATATAFLAWWLPYDMGVRPEAVVALCGAVTAAALPAAVRTRRPAFAWPAMAAAGAGAVAHPGGVVVLGVLLAGFPALVPLLRGPGADPPGRGTVALRTVAVGSGLAIGSLLGFADGALRDVLRGQAAVEAVLGPDGWADEVMRYAFLLDPVPMGSGAKRAAVLTCLVALAWFGVLAVAARARRVPLPAPLVLTGSATALGFAALSLTPSKWTHHFGALAGVGAAFLGLLLATGVPLTRAVLAGGRLPRVVPAALAASVAVTCALVWHGPNSWAYAWLDGVAAAFVRPAVGGLTLDHPLLWLVLVGVVALAVAARARRRTGDGAEPGAAVLQAVPLVVAASLIASAVFTVSAFGMAAARGTPPGSLWADGLADPAGVRCGASSAVRVLDPTGATPLSSITAPGAIDGFVAGSGYYPGDRPPLGPVWGSLAGDGVLGTATTSWYALPVPAQDTATAVLVAGSFGDGTGLTAVYGRRGSTDVAAVGSAPLGDGETSAHWRTMRLEPPPGADAVRLEAVDVTGAPHGWLAFTAPAVARAVTLQQLLPPDAPVALGWQLAFAHPCQRPPAVLHGITEPPAYAVLRAGEPDATPLAALGDIAWQADRGGVFAQVPRAQSVLALATVPPVDPYVRVYALGSPLQRSAYTLVPGERTVNGTDTGVDGGPAGTTGEAGPPR
jgi:hypothetical protein